MKTDSLTKSIISEFDKEYPTDSGMIHVMEDELKSFLRYTIQKVREEEQKKVREIAKNLFTILTRNKDQALHNESVLQLLNYGLSLKDSPTSNVDDAKKEGGE